MGPTYRSEASCVDIISAARVLPERSWDKKEDCRRGKKINKARIGSTHSGEVVVVSRPWASADPRSTLARAIEPAAQAPR